MIDCPESVTHEKGYGANSFICRRIFDFVAVDYNIIKVEDPVKGISGK